MAPRRQVHLSRQYAEEPTADDLERQTRALLILLRVPLPDAIPETARRRGLPAPAVGPAPTKDEVSACTDPETSRRSPSEPNVKNGRRAGYDTVGINQPTPRATSTPTSCRAGAAIRIGGAAPGTTGTLGNSETADRA